MPQAGTAPAAGGAIVTDDTVESYLSNIGVDGEERAFFKHGILEGGHIVLIGVPNDKTELAAKTLVEAGGRAPQTE